MESTNKKISKPVLVKAQKPDMSTDHSLKSATVTTSFSSNKKEGRGGSTGAAGDSGGGQEITNENPNVKLIKAAKPAMSNTAFQHVSKHFDFVLGVDFHWTVTPLTWVPLPLPHAFVGVIFDPMEYIHFTLTIPFIKVGDPPQPFSMPMGGTMYVHGRHKASTTTSVMGVAIPGKHLTGMIPAYLIVDLPMAPHEGEVYYGSKTVKTQGSELSGNQPNHVLTCWSPPMGLKPLPSMPDKPKGLAYFAFYSRFLKMYVQINTGKPVLVGGEFIPHDYTLKEYLMRFAGMAIMKGITKLIGAGLKKLGTAFSKTKLAGKMKALGTKALTNVNNKFLKKVFGKNNPLSKKLCKNGFEPINFVTGAMSFEWDDFELLGSTPIKCKNAWYSDKPFDSMFGKGIFNSFDLKIIPDEESEIAAWNHPDELIAVPIPMTDVDDEPYYYRAQKIEMHRPSSQEWIVTHNQNTYSYTRFHDAEIGEIFRISHIEYADGTRLRFEYQNSNYNILARITDGAGRKLLFETNERKNKITEIFYSYKESSELQVYYQYDQRGNLTHVTDAFGKSIVFEYNNDDLILKRTNRNGMEYVWKYDEERRVIETTGIDKFQHGIIKYHPEEGYNEIIYPEIAGKTEKIHYDEDQIIYLEEDAMGGETWYEHNAHNEKMMTASPEGRTVGYEYDEYGNVKTYHTPDGEQFLYSYNQRGQLLSRTEPSGASEYWEYDKLHRLMAYTAKDGNQVTYFYEENKRLPYKAVDKKGFEINWKYNEFSQVTEAVTSTGRVQQWNYDEYGRLTAYIPEEGKRSLWKRDKMGRVKAVYDIGQKPLKFKYDAYDLPIFATDGNEEWQMEYTPMGSLKKQSRASALRPDKKAVLHFEYDAYENLSSIRNEKNETYRFLRNKNDAVIEETGFDGQKKRYTRNTDGQVVRTVFADGKQVFYDYDLAGRLVYTNYNDGFWESFQYNKSGLLEKAMNPMAKVQFERNQLGLVTKEIQGEHHVEYEYDEAGNLQSLKSSLGAEVGYAYDDIGYLSQVTANNSITGTGNHDQAWQMMLKRNSAGQETSRAMTGGIASEMEYDHAGRPVSQKVTTGNTKKLHTQYQWAEGNRLQSAMNSLTGGKTDYAYDTFGSLSGAKYDDGKTLLKNPDEVGNLYKTEGRKDRIYGKSGKLLKDEKWYYLYDAQGNLRLKTARSQDTTELNQIQKEQKPKKFSFFIEEVKDEKPSPKSLDYYLRTDIQYTKEEKEEYKRLKEQQVEEKISHQQWQHGDWEYIWLANGMLQSVRKPDGSIVSFEYDALGRRTAKIANGKINRYLWNGNVLLHEWNYNLADRPKLSIDNEGKVGYDKEEPLDNLITWVYDFNSFNPSAKIVNGKTYAIVNDYLGTPIQAYDELGEKVWERELDIYGKPRKGGNDFIPFLYQGQYYDDETGLAYNRFRYYNPESGGYISQDPIGLEGNNPNFYAYVYNSNSEIDPLGLDLKPENGYLRGQRHGIKLSNKDAQILANNPKKPLPHGRWGNKADLTYAGKLADQLEPGGFHDFPVNSDSKSTVFHSGVDPDIATANPATHYRLRNNGDGTFHGFPIDGTAEKIQGTPAKFKPEYQ